MPSPRPKARRYATDELLSLRSSLPVVSFLVKKVNKHPDIGTHLLVDLLYFKVCSQSSLSFYLLDPRRSPEESRALLLPFQGAHRRHNQTQRTSIEQQTYI